MIDSLELRNWKAHKSTNLRFIRGTNILVGMMGSGKSTAMDAITFAFFGTYPAIKHRSASISDIIRNIPEQENEATVKLSFHIGDDSYSVERTVSSNGSSKATLTKNGDYFQSDPKRVNEEIERILKVDYDLFSRAVYSEQNNIDHFMRLGAKDRKEEIDGLLGLDKFTLAEDNSGSLINRIRDMTKEQRKNAERFDIKAMKAQLEMDTTLLNESLEEKAMLENDLESRGEALRKEEGRLKMMKEENAHRINLAKEIAELESKLEYINGEIKKSEGRTFELSMDQLKSRILKEKERMSELKRLEKNAADTESRLGLECARLRAEIEYNKEKIAERDRIVAKSSKIGDAGEIQRMIKKEAAELESHDVEIASLMSSKKEDEKWLSELERHISKCPICERELEEEMRDRLYSERKSRIERSSVEIESRQRRRDEKRRALGEMQNSLNELNIAHEKIRGFAGIDEKLVSISSAFESASKRLESAKKDRAEARNSADRSGESVNEMERLLEQMSRLEAHRSNAAAIGARIAEKTLERKQIRVSDAEIEEAQGRFTEMSASFYGIKVRVESLERYVKERRSVLEGRREEVGKVQKMLDDADRKEQTAMELAKFKEAVGETKNILRARLIDSINRVMQDTWNELYPYGDYQSVMLDSTPDDYVLKVLLKSNGKDEWRDVETIASGGERSIACLNLRVAFSLVLVPNLRWIILDEPTHNIDKKGLERFIRVFNETLPNIVDQIFIITHDEILKQIGNSKIYVFARDKEGYEPTVVSDA